MDIKVKLPEHEIPDTGAVGQVLTPLGFAFIEGESNAENRVALYRNQSAKGLDVQNVRAKVADAGGEVIEVA